MHCIAMSVLPVRTPDSAEYEPTCSLSELDGSEDAGDVDDHGLVEQALVVLADGVLDVGQEGLDKHERGHDVGAVRRLHLLGRDLRQSGGHACVVDHAAQAVLSRVRLSNRENSLKRAWN